MSFQELDMPSFDGLEGEQSLERGSPASEVAPITVSEGFAIRVTQLKALAYKELCFSIKREWLSTLIRLLLPSVIVLGFLIVVLLHPTLSSDLHPSTSLLGNIPKCTTDNDDGRCVTLLYNINGALEVNYWGYFSKKAASESKMREGEDSATLLSDNRNFVLQTMRSLYNETGLWYDEGSQQEVPMDDLEAEAAVMAKAASPNVADTQVAVTREMADAVMRIMCETNPDTEIEFGKDVLFTELADDDLRAELYSKKMSNSTLGAVEFLPTTFSETGEKTYNYRIMYNSTEGKDFNLDGTYSYYYYNNLRYEIEAAVERSLLIYLAQEGEAGTLNDISFSAGYKKLPSTNAADTAVLLWTLAIPVLLIPIGAHYLYVQVNMSADKETGRRGQLKLAGLRDSSYWCATLTRQFFFAFISLGLMVAIGWILPPFVLFSRSALLPLLFIFLTFACFFAAIANLTSVLVATRKVAIILSSLHFGFFLVITFLLSLSGTGLISIFNTDSYFPFGLLICAIFPPLSYAAILMEVMLNTIPGSGSRYSCYWDFEVDGYGWIDFLWNPTRNLSSQSYCKYYRAAPASVLLLILLVEAGILLLLALWLDKARADKHKAGIGCCFCLRPSYWRRGQLGRDGYQQAALAIEHLTKTYKAGLFRTGGTTAIRPFKMESQSDSVLCLLGPNGAGKTTIIGCLTGLVQPTEGEAFIYGYSIQDSMDSIRSMMGVCPQFDMLFSDLSAWEHLRIVNWMKRPCDRMTDEELLGRLEAVRLTSVKDQAVKTYSGGMQRRLSFVLSTVGNPRVLFLDEPTTGMDPSNRRYVWDLVRSIKKGRLIVLTTHSMEEADMLGDQIAIVAAGKLRCEGSPLELKVRFGLGYRLSISCDPSHVDEVKRLANRHLPVAQLRGDNAGALVYSLPDVDKSSSEFFELLLSTRMPDGSPLIDDWGCQNTTMEDVFLTVSRKIMGQDITFDASNKRSQLDRDEREIFQESTRRLDRRIRKYKEEAQELRDLLAQHGIDASGIAGAADREEQLEVQGD